ncbi:hypothetical protein B0H16DRAFT_1765526 [Mycena metata]|uniref:Uncharacterized protein n=1 Tax=Mycena metata TaxID=1033252 RepID=A0AAD7MVY0_9AGAR|nr:hypothetical protein B0H16DRAFT_1765526 [Mycena metata]
MLGVNLVEARIYVNFDNDEPWPDVEAPIHLPRLRRLYVSHAEVLDYLVAPALEEIAFWSTEDIKTQSCFGSFVDRSGCTLRRLVLEGDVEAVTVARLLKVTTSIVELVIISTSPADFADLTVVPDAVPIAPQLQFIDIAGKSGRRPDYDMYVQMIYSRWQQPHRAVRATSLLSIDRLGSQWHHALEDLRREGLDFRLEEGVAADEAMRPLTYQPTWN